MILEVLLVRFFAQTVRGALNNMLCLKIRYFFFVFSKTISKTLFDTFDKEFLLHDGLEKGKHLISGMYQLLEIFLRWRLM